MNKKQVQESIVNELQGGPVEQEWLVDHLSAKHGIQPDEVLSGLNKLMCRNRVSHNLEWKLQLEPEDKYMEA